MIPEAITLQTMAEYGTTLYLFVLFVDKSKF